MIKAQYFACSVLIIILGQFSALSLFSQQKDIKYMVGIGAYAGYNVTTRSFDSARGLELNTTFTTGISPKLGVLVNPRLILGGQIISGFSSYFGSTTQKDSVRVNYDESFFSIGIAPFLRFLLQDFGNQIIPFVEGGLLFQPSLGFRKEKGEVKSSFDVVYTGNICIGLSIFYTKNMSLEPCLRYTYLFRENSNINRNIHDLTFGINWQIFLSSLLPENLESQ
jgi:hypothetical protein